MKRLRAPLSTGLLALAAACVLDAHAQVASPPPGKALVVMYRSDRQPVSAKVPVIANADRLGDVGNGEFVNAIVNPGRTFLRAGDRILTTLALQASAGQTYYVLIEAVPGMTPVRVEMRQMTEASARRILAQSRPIGAAPAAAAPRAAVPPAAVVAPAAAAPRVAAAPPPKPAAPPPPRPAPAPRASPPPRPAPPPPAASSDEDDLDEAAWHLALIAKAGTFKLSNPSQTIGTPPLLSSYDKSSKPVAGAELEFRHRSGFALGGEVFYYKNELTAPGNTAGTTFTGEQAVVMGAVNAKYYLGLGDWFHPFVGAGVGFANSSFSGDLTGKAAGPAIQAMAGVDLRFGTVGFYLEYKHVNSTVADSASNKIKVGGSGILAGVSVAF
jgi:opacity protein-like surface antigen